ncbi:MAG: iron-containing alcohol dehydrogenase [Bdellovibrionota bacterium]
MPKYFHSLPSRVNVADGCSAMLGAELKRLGVKKVLLVSDKGVDGAGLLAPLRQSIEQAGIGIAQYLDVEPNPLVSQARGAEKAYKDAKCDGLVAVGGGSVMDVAKCVRVMAIHSGDILDYEATKGGLFKIQPAMPSLVCLPTTSGTGSEVSVAAVVTDEKNHVKKLIVSPFLVPTLALDDPKLTYGLPAFHTASTGMDALTHAIEAYVSNMPSPLGSACALEAVKLIGENLRASVKEPTNASARFHMMYAAMLAGVAFTQNNLGAVHATAHQLSTEFGFAHGMANAIMLTPVMRYNLPSATKKYAEVAVALGAKSGGSDSSLAEEAVEIVTRLRADVGLPGTIREGKGAKPSDLKRLAAQAMGDVCHMNNPKPCNPGVMEQFFRDAGADAA